MIFEIFQSVRLFYMTGNLRKTKKCTRNTHGFQSQKEFEEEVKSYLRVNFYLKNFL
jgi:hypothetical protein